MTMKQHDGLDECPPLVFEEREFASKVRPVGDGPIPMTTEQPLCGEVSLPQSSVRNFKDLAHFEALSIVGENPRCIPKDRDLELNNCEFIPDEWVASDDVKGSVLDPSLVHQAREKELKYLKEMGVYKYCATTEALRLSGKKPLRLKWIDTNKGGG